MQSRIEYFRRLLTEGIISSMFTQIQRGLRKYMFRKQRKQIKIKHESWCYLGFQSLILIILNWTINAIILVGTLKTSSEISNTDLLSEFFAKHLLTYGVRSEIIRLIDYDIRPGVYTRVDSDDWHAIYEKIMVTDIVVFATPVWWGIQSSLQRVIERLDEIHDEIMESGKSKLTNKVAGIRVTAQMELNILLVT